MSSEFSELTCFFLCQVDGLPKLIKVYTGGYTVGTVRCLISPVITADMNSDVMLTLKFKV